MAKTYPKIILLKEDVDTEDYAAHAVKSGEIINALTKMQTDFMPQEDTIQVNPEGSFFVANLTTREAKKLEEASEVLAVVDDEPVKAFNELIVTEETPVRQITSFKTRNGFSQVYSPDDGLTLALDPDEQEMLERELQPEWEEGVEPLSPQQLAVLCSVDRNGALSSDLEILLSEQFGRTSAQPYEDYGEETAGHEDIRYTNEQVATVAREVVRRILRDRNGSQPITEQEIDTVLRAMDLDTLTRVRFLRDIILPNTRLVNAPPAWRFAKGARARLAIIDTGIDPRHPDLRVVGGVSFVPGVSSWRDDNGHGTHVAGTAAALMNRRGIVGVAPQADVFAVKVLNRMGQGMKSWVLNGLLWCHRFGMHVANLSLGSDASTHSPAVYDPAYEHVGRILRRRGIISVAAAGNSNHRPVGNPARCPSFMAVSAVDFSRRLTTFTNIGPQVEICAPGLGVLSTLPGNRYGRLSGTSMAAPHVAGGAALVKSRRSWLHGDSIRLRLMLTATDLGSAGRDWAFGHGLLNCYQAIL